VARRLPLLIGGTAPVQTLNVIMVPLADLYIILDHHPSHRTQQVHAHEKKSPTTLYSTEMHHIASAFHIIIDNFYCT
jgi:hypothetical protein